MNRKTRIELVHEAMILNLEGINNTVDHHDQEMNDLADALYDQLIICTELWYQGEKTAL